MKKYFVSFFSLLSFPSHLLFLIWVYFRYMIGMKTKPLNVDWNAFSMDKTFIRWGDGETMVALGMPMVFTFQYEKSSKRLSEKMKSILAYAGDRIVIGLPKEYLIKEEDDTKDMRAWIITRNFFQSKFNACKSYDDAFFYRHLANYENFLKLYEWKKIFLVTNQDSIDKISSDGRLPTVWHYAIPGKNAFDSYDDFKWGIIWNLNALPDRNDLIVLISGWPAWKVLAFELTTEFGYVCHDVGQFFDLYLKK